MSFYFSTKIVISGKYIDFLNFFAIKSLHSIFSFCSIYLSFFYLQISVLPQAMTLASNSTRKMLRRASEKELLYSYFTDYQHWFKYSYLSF